MPGTRIFLTGATGNAGQYVFAELTRRGLTVTALVRKPTELPGCRTVVGELATIDRLASEIGNAEAIVHLACANTQESEPILRGDILGTSLLASAWSSGPFIYISSATIYGYGRPQSDLTEDSPIDVSSWYEAIKFTNEFQLRIAEQRGKRGPCIRLRPGMLVTTSERCRNLQLLSFFYRHCCVGSKFIFDSEEGLESYGCSYIGGPDFGRAVVHSLNIKAAGPYNVAAGFCTWRALIETINRHAGTHADFLIRPGAEPGPGECRPPQSRTFLDVSAFCAQTGFVPQQVLEELVQEFVQAERVSTTSKPAMKTVS
jgi:nucleoside-diphosphate-sugar epimerase